MNIAFPSRIMFKRQNIPGEKLIPTNLIGHLIGNPYYCPDFKITASENSLTFTPMHLIGKIWKRKYLDEKNNLNIDLKNIINTSFKKRLFVYQLHLTLTSGEELFVNIKYKHKNTANKLIKFINKK